MIRLLKRLLACPCWLCCHGHGHGDTRAWRKTFKAAQKTV